jgi:hypothetical protein
VIRELWALGLEVERVAEDAHLVRFRDRWVWLLEGAQDVRLEVFVLHVLEGADAARLNGHLLFRNRELRRVHYCLDEVGDVFLVGSLQPEELDAVLGELWLALGEDLGPIAYGPVVPEKARLDGAGRRMAGTPWTAPRRDLRR